MAGTATRDGRMEREGSREITRTAIPILDDDTAAMTAASLVPRLRRGGKLMRVQRGGGGGGHSSRGAEGVVTIRIVRGE